ncbi:MAG: hypothetical protein WC829_04795 [Hyphomicrobium sp.]
MNKSPIAIALAALIAAIAFASSAQAGFKIRLGFGGPLPAFTAHSGGYSSSRHYHRKRYVERRVRVKKEKAVAKRKSSPAPRVAKKDTSVKKPTKVATAPTPEPDVIADNENSSITAASIEPIATSVDVTEAEQSKTTVGSVEAKPAKSASKLDCKKFFPSVGMTLTVPCE